MPEFLRNLATMINQMPTSPEWLNNWRRLRIALTEEEKEKLIAYFLEDTKDNPGGSYAALAIRGVPVIVEEFPRHPMIEVITDARTLD